MVDPFTLMLNELESTMTEEIASFCQTKKQNNDKKFNMMFQAYLTNKDGADFLHTVNRYYKKENK